MIQRLASPGAKRQSNAQCQRGVPTESDHQQKKLQRAETTHRRSHNEQKAKSDHWKSQT
jgi:hypothetical protein